MLIFIHLPETATALDALLPAVLDRAFRGELQSNRSHYLHFLDGLKKNTFAQHGVTFNNEKSYLI